MKLTLFAISLFAVIFSLCVCSSPSPKKNKWRVGCIPFLNKEHIEHSDEEKTASGNLKHPKIIKSAIKQAGRPKNTKRRVSFNKNIEICNKSTSSVDDSEIFWLSYKNFAPIISKQLNIFPNDSAESEFISLIQFCIERNFAMFDLLYQSAAMFSSYDSYVCPIEQNIKGEAISFPNSTKFWKTKTTRENFEETIITFLDNVIPAYELNEHLLNSVQSMDEKTKIDPKMLEKISQEDDKISVVWETFWMIFEKFTLNEYMQALSGIRQTINYLEFAQIDLIEANKRLDHSLSILSSSAPKINVTLNLAWIIDFEKLQRATKALYSYVKQALEVGEASSSK